MYKFVLLMERGYGMVVLLIGFEWVVGEGCDGGVWFFGGFLNCVDLGGVV